MSVRPVNRLVEQIQEYGSMADSEYELAMEIVRLRSVLEDAISELSAHEGDSEEVMELRRAVMMEDQ